MKRDFLTEVKEATFQPLSFTTYMKLDDEGYILVLESLHGKKFGIEDFEVYKFSFTNREKVVMKVRNKEYLTDMNEVIKRANAQLGIRHFVNYDEGKFMVVKLKTAKFED